MRWEQLFDDLEARFDALAEEEMRAELADRTRVAVGAVRLTARLAGAVGERVRVRTQGQGLFEGMVRRTGPDWLLLARSVSEEILVALSAVTAVDGLVARTGREPSGVAMRLDLRHMVRGLARDRSPVAVHTRDLAGSEPVEWTGTIDRVGADYLELAQHAPWEARRSGSVRLVTTLPLAAVAAIRTRPIG